MWSALRVMVVGCSLLSCLGCSDDSPPGDECTLPDDPEFDISGTSLQANASHSSCPTDVPAGLGSDELEDESICEREISDCAIHLTCEVSGITIKGKLGERDGNLVGRVEVTKPIACVYEVTGKFR